MTTTTSAHNIRHAVGADGGLVVDCLPKLLLFFSRSSVGVFISKGSSLAEWWPRSWTDMSKKGKKHCFLNIRMDLN